LMRFSEEKNGKPVLELPRGHVPANGLKAFKAVSKETSTQLIKIMYLTAVSSTGPIGNYEMDWSEHTKVIKTGARKGEVVAAKVDSEFLKPFWIKIHTGFHHKATHGT